MTTRPFFFLLAAALSAAVSAQPYRLGDLSIERPWARELPPVAPNGAAYLRIGNGGYEADHVVSVSSPIADRVEFHAHEMDGAVMKMRHVHTVEIAAQGAVSFEPGGMHMMLIGLKEPLVAGKSFPLTLGFHKAGAIEVMVEITRGAMPDHSSHGADKQGQMQ